MTKKIFAISLLILAMIILPMMSLHRSPTEIKEEQEKRQQHFAYATLTLLLLLLIPNMLILTLLQ